MVNNLDIANPTMVYCIVGLVVQACADCYCVRIHLVTTHSDNHHLVVEPSHEAVCNICIGFHSEMHYVSAQEL